jgi:hypothetical protein
VVNAPRQRVPIHVHQPPPGSANKPRMAAAGLVFSSLQPQRSPAYRSWSVRRVGVGSLLTRVLATPVSCIVLAKERRASQGATSRVAQQGCTTTWCYGRVPHIAVAHGLPLKYHGRAGHATGCSLWLRLRRQAAHQRHAIGQRCAVVVVDCGHCACTLRSLWTPRTKP